MNRPPQLTPNTRSEIGTHLILDVLQGRPHPPWHSAYSPRHKSNGSAPLRRQSGSNMTNIRSVVKVLFIFIALATASCKAGETTANHVVPLPSSMIGDWHVIEVLTDPKDTEQCLGEQYTIQKYLGRVVTMTSDSFSINTHYDGVCENVKVLVRKMTAGEIVSKSVSTRLFSTTRPTPEDLQLPLAGDIPVDALYSSCNGKPLSKDQGMTPLQDLSNVVWFIDLNNDKLAMSWHEQTVLILSRLNESIKPVASFDCSKAGTMVEKTICSSVGLAAYDTSLAQTYTQARNYYRSQNDAAAANELSHSQKTWLKLRDSCNDNVECLEKTMSNRVSDIIYDLGDYLYQHR